MGRVKPGRQRRASSGANQARSAGEDHGITMVSPYVRNGRTHFGWIDARAHGPGVQFFAAPVETAGWQKEDSWVRLLYAGRNGTEGPADRLARLLATSTSGPIAAFENRTVAYAATADNGLGALFEIDNDRLDQADSELEGPLEDLGVAYRARYPLEYWEQFGRAMQERILPLIDPAEPRPELVMGFHVCSACGRPVFDSCPSLMARLPGGRGIAMVCPACADGSMWRLCQQLAADGAPPVDPKVLTSLEHLHSALTV
ncbi:hypothetical protein ACE1OC_42945 (plasmid) [Streptomyces sp. DSM 116496]|uniref:hypothetical protein n=1 Tax=Streptomyces stoeckheimensis TaxID=3344656 RepID=UPI0038B2490E